MSGVGLQRSLHNITMFDGCKSNVINDLENACNWRTWAAGQNIISQGDPNKDVYFLISGVARVIIYSPQGKVVAFRQIEAGEMIGEFSALDLKARSATVAAREPCITASASSETFWQIIETEPSVARHLILHLTAQIRNLTDRVYEYSALAVNNRLHAELLRIAIRDRNDKKTGIVDLAPTHSELALRISSHREAVTRELGRLQRNGLVIRKGPSLVITDMEKFLQMVEATSLGVLID